MGFACMKCSVGPFLLASFDAKRGVSNFALQWQHRAEQAEFYFLNGQERATSIGSTVDLIPFHLYITIKKQPRSPLRFSAEDFSSYCLSKITDIFLMCGARLQLAPSRPSPYKPEDNVRGKRVLVYRDIFQASPFSGKTPVLERCGVADHPLSTPPLGCPWRYSLRLIPGWLRSPQAK